MKQFVITPAMGKRLIAKATANHPDVRAAAGKGVLAIVAGTTNSYVAQEVLSSLGQAEGFSPGRFFRGLTQPPSRPATPSGRLPEESGFLGDVIITGGVWDRGKTIFDVAGQLQAGDVVIKGANALDIARGRAAVLIGHPACGTAGALLPAVVGRRVKLIVPIGLEKRICADVVDQAELLNASSSTGPRMLPLPGEVITELEAVKALTGATGRLVAAGGVYGAEGAVWIAAAGSDEQVEAADELIRSVADEPIFGA